MMKWWWVGLYGALKRRRRQGAAAALSASASASASRESVALVIGSTSIVGATLLDVLSLPDCPGGPWKVYAIPRVALPPWSAAPPRAITRLHVDLADSAAVGEALAPLTDITHVFYVDGERGPTEAENREINCAMLRNVLSAVVPNCPELAHVCLQTNRKKYIDPFEPLSGIAPALRPYSEDLPRLSYPDLEDTLLDGLALPHGGSAITWSVHRPSLVFGFSPCSGASNVVSSLCVYAAICRKLGTELLWPGSRVAWEGFSDASDAELVAEHALWAVAELPCKNMTFNCSNGDVFKWKKLWSILAGRFGIEYWEGYGGEDQRFKLAESMAGMETAWGEIVEEKELVKTQLHEITNWSFVDSVINVEKEALDTMNKSKEYGFFGFRNMMSSFDAWIGKLKADKIVP